MSTCLTVAAVAVLRLVVAVNILKCITVLYRNGTFPVYFILLSLNMLVNKLVLSFKRVVNTWMPP